MTEIRRRWPAVVLALSGICFIAAYVVFFR
jgi:hypothetical protein